MKKKYMPAFVVCLLILVLAVAGGAVHVISKYIPTKDRMDLNEYYGQVAEGEAALILGTEKLEQRGIIVGEEGYLPLDVVNTYLNQRYYWDEENQQILYATPSEVTSMSASSEAGSEVWLRNGTVYLSLSYIRQYTDLDTYIYENPGRIAIQYQFSDVNTVTAKKDTYVRFRGGIKSEVLTKVQKGTNLILMEELEDWSQVATMDGYIGYVQKKAVSQPEKRTFERQFSREEYNYIKMEQPVNLVWHQVTNMEANAGFAEATANMTGVNVISPTWYSIIDNEGNISSLASSDYVSQAHEKGLKVWGLVDNFNENISTTEILSRTSSRQNLVRQLVDAALSAGLDGINIDFEYLEEAVGIHFLQFLRELSVETHKNNLVLSVDNPVPEDFTSHYDRAEQGRVVDYVIIMGYDEHYVGSEEAGSVASLPWVEKGIQDTLAEVPAERVINAVPFYSRLWKTLAGTLSSEAIGMGQVQEVISKYKVETYWDKNTSQNYGTFENEGAEFQIWIEDAQSIAEKVKLSSKYNLAGVAAWKLGFESSDVWQAISNNLK
ncbi:MAG: glycosyl hydrolase family 18 protein [Eubacteriales bacterium]|nr:glycosyl hydrolase family 18 protein [Eubacteriales bacterium]